MYLDRPMVLRPQVLPGLPAGSQILPVPFADLVTAGLAARAVELAKRERAVRLVIAVCQGCTTCELFGTIVAASAEGNEIRVTMLYPRATGGPTASASPRDPGQPQGIGWLEQFELADLEPVAGSYADAVRASRHRARQLDDAVDGNVPGPAGNHGQYTTAGHLIEVLSMLPQPPATIWLPYDPATCAALDGAVRLLGWPSVLAAVATTAEYRAGGDVSALDAYLCPRITAADRVEPLVPAARTTARRILTDAGMSSTHDAHADGVAGLLTAHRDDRPVSTDLALVPLPSLALMHRRAPWPRTIAHRPDATT